MNKQMWGGMMVVAGVVAATAAQAQNWGGAGWGQDGVYVRGQGGWTDMRSNDFDTTAGRVKTQYKDGWNVGGAVGVKRGPMRYEGEVYRQESDVKSQSLNGGALGGPGGTGRLDAVMANAYYDMGTGRLKPYVGGGVGAAQVKFKGYNGGGASLMNTDDNVLAYQGMAGVSYELNPCWSVNAEYRYVGTTDAEVRSTTGVKNDVAYRSNNLLLGVTYKF